MAALARGSSRDGRSSSLPHGWPSSGCAKTSTCTDPLRAARAGLGSGSGALVVEVRIRLGSGIAQFAPAPVLTVQLPNGATIDDLCDQLASSNPQLGASLGSALPVLGGMHVMRRQPLANG